MSHTHAHPPHELTEPASHPAGPDRRERVLELVAVLVLSAATFATAWSGYEAARWSGEQSQRYASASTARVEANQQTTAAGQLRIDDLLNFNGWLQARAAGEGKLAALYESRFRPEFVPAFRAWRAQPRPAGVRAISSPLYMPQYQPPETARALALDREADARFKQATDAKASADRYILSTVFFAAVLFFAGISLRLDWRPLRIAVLGMAGALLLGAIGFVASLPAV